MQDILIEKQPKWDPCPFCGSARTDGKCTPDLRLVFGVCLDCGAEGPKHEAEAEARRLWNTRAGDSEIASLRAALQAVLPVLADEAEQREQSGDEDYIAVMRDAEQSVARALGEVE